MTRAVRSIGILTVVLGAAACSSATTTESKGLSSAAGARAPGDATTASPADSAAPADAAASVPADAAASVTDECGLHTRFPGDEFCIKAPPEDKGFQLHLGPTNYDDPEPQYVLEPGQEVTEPYTGVSTNDRDIYFFYRQQRMRPGSHHLLIGADKQLIVASQNAVSDIPFGGRIAPEDQDVGVFLPAHSPLTGSVHYINTSDKPILKEAWINFWYKDKSDVKETATPIFTGAPINVPPGAHVLISGDCPIMGSGRILRLFGHKHANNVRWSTYRIRGDQRDLLFEDYDHWEDPLILEYSSITQNPAPDRATKSPGGWSGMLDVQQGDTLRFECEVINNTTKTFTGKNEAVDDEMCIQNGMIVGASLPFGTCNSATNPVD